MLRTFKKLSIGLGVALLMVSCSTNMEDVTPSETLSGVSTDAAKAVNTNSFGFSNLRTDDGKTWLFDVIRIGDKTGANANTVMLALAGCENQPITLSAKNVVSISVTRAGGIAQVLVPTYFESGANACPMAATPGYVRFADFEGNVKDGSVYTFTVTLKESIQVTSATVGVKAGNTCTQGTMEGPGCVIEEDLCGEGQGYFHKAGRWEGNSVTLGGRTYTEAEGIALMTSDKKFGGKDNAGGIADSKAAFSQGATVLLNRKLGLISPNAYAAELTAINAYLATLNKLTTYSIDNLPTGNAAAKEAAGFIGENIDCEEVAGEK